MKTKLTILASVVLIIMTGCTSSQGVLVAGPNVSIYTEIPMAPNVVLAVETPIIVSPGPSHIWIDGYWAWDYHYREYVWMQGYWAIAPYAGAFWIPGYWEYYRGGYRWIDARWLPRDYQFRYGYYNGRYDYYGRPVYYDRPRSTNRLGYAFTYDNRPEYRSKGYNSSPSFNNAPRNERTRINREYQQQTRSSVQPANTDRNRQETIRIRENNTQGNRDSNTQGNRTPATTTPSRTQPDNNRTPATTAPSRTQPNNNRTPATTTPSRTQPDNNRQNATPARSNENRSSGSNESSVSRSSSSGENSRVRESSSSNTSRSSNTSSGSSSTSRTSSSESGRR